jgi:hypothetical protein
LSAPQRAALAADRPAGEAAGWSLRLRIASALLFVPLLILLARVGRIGVLAFVGARSVARADRVLPHDARRGSRPYCRLGIAAALGLLWCLLPPDTPHVASCSPPC